MIASDLALALDPAMLMRRAAMPPDPWQAGLLRSDANRVLLLCCRQAGKSTVTAALALHEAVYRPGALVLLLSPSLRQSGELFRKVAGYRRALGDAAGPAEESALRLELPNGSRIVSLPGSEETIRGYSGVRLLIVDEASRVPDALYYSVRPMLAVSRGRLIALSTPFGKRGWFHDEWTSGADWERVRITATDCPRIDKAFLEEERAHLGDRWYRQEYECAFEETVGQMFSHDSIQAMLDATVQPLFGQASGAGALDSGIRPLQGV